MLSRRAIFCRALAAFALVAVIAAGCGKKGDPVAPRLIPLPAVSGLTAESVAEGILLRWSAAGPASYDRFRVERSDAPAGEACPGCPQEYRTLDEPRVGDPSLRSMGQGRFGYLDGAAAEGRYRAYRVWACDSRGRCGSPAALAGPAAGKAGQEGQP